MGEHYQMALRIGGRLPHSKVDEFMKLFLEAAWLPVQDRAGQLMDFVVNGKVFTHEEDECNPERFQELLVFCRHLGMSYTCHIGSNGVEGPEILYYQAYMKEEGCIPLTMAHVAFVDASAVRNTLQRYSVSVQEKLRAVQRLVPLEKPPAPMKLEVVDG